MKTKITQKQLRFCQAYLIDPNAKKAAVEAGYSKKTAQEQGSRLLTNVKVKEFLAEKQEKLAEKTGITQEMVVNEYKKIAFTNLDDVVNWEDGNVRIKKPSEIESFHMGALSEIAENQNQYGTQRKIKLHDKKGALDSLAKHLGMFTEKHEVSLMDKSLNQDNEELKAFMETDEGIEAMAKLARQAAKNQIEHKGE